MVTLKVLKARLDSSNTFYSVLRVVKMTSMAKFNEITKHAKVRDWSLRIPARLLNSIYSNEALNSLVGIMMNSGKCRPINVNVMQSLAQLAALGIKLITYVMKGFSICNKFSGYVHTIFESGSTSRRNILLASRIVNTMSYGSASSILFYNRYYGITGRSVSCCKVPSYEVLSRYSINFIKSIEVRYKILHLNKFGGLCCLFNYLVVTTLLNSLFENNLSECSARVQSLETALKNLETIIEDLRKHIINEDKVLSPVSSRRSLQALYLYRRMPQLDTTINLIWYLCAMLGIGVLYLQDVYLYILFFIRYWKFVNVIWIFIYFSIYVNVTTYNGSAVVLCSCCRCLF